jgi:histidinol-phosphatase (PHP family)
LSTSYLAHLVDYHVHHERCGHAVATMEAYVRAALERGLGEMGFSDHLYLYWVPADRRDPELGMREEQLDDYVAEAHALQQAYPGIRLRLGLEVDYIPGWEPQLGTILARHSWDYLLGSVHFLGDWGFDQERYLDGYARRDVDEVYRTYYELVGAAAETGLFDVMTHLDLPKKFGHRPRGDLRLEHERLVGRLARAGVTVEVNTAGLRKPVGELYPALDLLTLCHEAGVPATLSSDSHRPADVAAGFDLALEHLARAGYREYAAFEGRRREMRPLPPLPTA